MNRRRFRVLVDTDYAYSGAIIEQIGQRVESHSDCYRVVEGKSKPFPGLLASVTPYLDPVVITKNDEVVEIDSVEDTPSALNPNYIPWR